MLYGRENCFKNNNEQWITTQASRKDGYFYRAISGAIITGSGTLETDDPLLNVRLEEAVNDQDFKQPLKLCSQQNHTLIAIKSSFKIILEKLFLLIMKI